MALTKWFGPTTRHEIEDAGRVGWLELFFDLVYVAALIQLGDRLADDVSWGGVARFVGAFVVLWWTWTGTTILVNRFAVDDVAHRVLTFVQMFAVGNFAVVATTGEIGDRSTLLVVAYVTARVPLLIMYARVRSRVPEARPMADLYLGVFSFSLVIWGGSLLVAPAARWWIWAAALALEFAAPIVGVRDGRTPPTHPHHFQERYALFTIIVLGETFVKTLSKITEIGVSAQAQVFGGLSFVILIALWWTYFDDVAESEVASRSPLSASAGVNRLAWAYIHLPLAIGLTAFGVAAKKVVSVESFGDDLKDTYSWLLVGALVMVLVAAALLDVVTVSPHFGVRTAAQVRLRLVSAVIVVAIGTLLAGGTLSALAGVGLIAGVVAAQIAVEVVLASRADRRVAAAIDRHRVGGGCDHLGAAQQLPGVDRPAAPSCAACDDKGAPWVQLRLCLACGQVGCCDDSPGQHATAHYEETGHRLIATLEPGDEWAYCFADDSTDPSWWVGHRAAMEVT